MNWEVGGGELGSRMVHWEAGGVNWEVEAVN